MDEFTFLPEMWKGFLSPLYWQTVYIDFFSWQLSFALWWNYVLHRKRENNVFSSSTQTWMYWCWHSSVLIWCAPKVPTGAHHELIQMESTLPGVFISFSHGFWIPDWFREMYDSQCRTDVLGHTTANDSSILFTALEVVGPGKVEQTNEAC